MYVSIIIIIIIIPAQLLEPLLVQSLTWSVGGLCDAPGRIRFDAVLREKLKAGGSRANLPREVTNYILIRG